MGCALIASARHVLASSALIGVALSEWGAGAGSANKVDPASANAMSVPRALMIVFMAACQTLQCLAAGMNGEANEPQPAENSSQLEDHLPIRTVV